MSENNSQQNNTIGANIKTHRVRLNMTQEYVAETINVSRQAVSKWECGESEPSTANLILLAELFGISADELLRVSEKDNQEAQNKFIRLFKRHKVMSVIYVILLILCLCVGSFAICDTYYYKSTFYVTENDMQEFIEKDLSISQYEIPPYPSIMNETDRFVLACNTTYFNTTPIEHTRKTDVLFKDENGRYLIICFKTDKNYTAKQVFYDIAQGNQTAKIKRPFLSSFRSAAAEQYYMNDINQPFIQSWFIGDKYVVLISETKESGEQIKEKIIKHLRR